MAIRTIEHPGVQITESDQSMVAPNFQMLTALILGYADKGEDLVPEVFSSINSYQITHGKPRNDAEIYSYNAVKEVLSNGGNIVFSKLPYDNATSASYRAIGCDITTSGDGNIATSGLFGLPTSATSLQFIDVPSATNLITFDMLDALRTQDDFTGLVGLTTKSFVIVDVARDIVQGNSENEGVFVVIVPAYNAIPYQQLMDQTLLETSAPCVGWAVMSGIVAPDAADMAVSGAYGGNSWVLAPGADSSWLYDSISKNLARQFPSFWNRSSVVDRTYMNQVVVMVCKSYSDRNNGNLLNIDIIEKYTGSLCKDDTDPSTGQSIFLGDLINSRSEYIEFYFNVLDEAYPITNITKGTTASTTGKTYAVRQAEATAEPESVIWPLLSFTLDESVKKISPSQMLQNMDTLLQKVTNIDEQRLDVVLDAGLSNIYQYASNHGTASSLYVPGTWSSLDSITSSPDLDEWTAVASKLITFCSETRKDCMAILDGPRALALQGEQKIVRSTKPNNTIDRDIIPKLRYLMGLNTSYAAMYVSWMKILDDFSGQTKWIPESIKAAGRYCYTERVFNFWEAPYGMERGVITGVLELAFNPDGKQEDQIYIKGLNYAKEFPMEGIIVQGQRTLQAMPSAFDRVNVRRLFLKTERLTYDISKYFVGKINNFYTRSQLVDILDPKFANIKRLGGIFDYRIVCNETNNTDEVIDNKELKLSVLIKPSQVADYILVNFVALRTGGSFEEILVD